MTSSSKDYVCPMHADVTSDSPGSCMKCGMDLVPRHELDQKKLGGHSTHVRHHASEQDAINDLATFYACPMHPEIKGFSPGICPRCHMALELVKPSNGSSSNSEHNETHQPNVFRAKFWVSLALTIPTVLFSPMIQSWLGYDLSFTGSQYIPALLGIIIFLYGGLVFLRSARGEIAARRPGMMTLISMAISVALAYSLLVTFGVVDGMDFWWELASLVTIMLLGHWIEMASIENAQGALGELAKLLPDEAELVHGDKSATVPVSELKVGNTFRLRPGSSVPVDGIVIQGESKMDESMLTGESRSIPKAKGDQVIGGTINIDGTLLVEVAKVGSETALAGIMKMVEEAQASKSKTQVLADKAAFYLFYISVLAALLTAVGWMIVGESTGFILERVVTVLIIACPHALGLAIPLVTAISTTHAAKNGLLVRDRAALEVARGVDVVLFDKTGTLTLGEQGVVEVVAVSGDKESLLSIAASVENNSEHSLAQAIVRYAKQKSVEVTEADNFTNLPGRGVKADIEDSEYYVGGPNLLKELKAPLDSKLKKFTLRASQDGKTVIYVVEEDAIIGAIALADVIRKESREAIAKLQSQGKRIAILTGDHEGVASWVAKELGVKEFFAQVLPGMKAAVVKQLQADGSKVMMVGDGVNDAPALSQADIGVAVGAGAGVAIESAGIVLAGNDPRGVSKIIDLSKASYKKMVQNLIWATGYNALALPLAAGVVAGLGFILSPALGAVMMSLSTVIVAINAQLLRRLKL